MKALAVIVVSLLTFSVNAQSIQFKASDTLKGEFDRFAVDNFGRLYVTKKDVIMVFSKDLDTLFTTSLKTIRPSYIESSKSFRTLVFDDERSVIQFLDNTLTDIYDEIDLVKLDIQQPILVCESFAGNAFWVLDADNLRLVKLNEKLQKIIVTENLTTIFDGTAYPTQMKEVNDYLLILVPGKGVAKFDIFGTYMDIYPCVAESIDAMGNYLFVRSEKTLEIIPLDGLMEPEYVYDLPVAVSNFAYTRNAIYFQTDVGIVIGNYVKSQ